MDRAAKKRASGVARKPILGLLLTLCSIGISAYSTFHNEDLSRLFGRDGTPIRFPDSGTVTVSPLATARRASATFSVTVPPDDLDNYVVRLDRPVDGRMVISIYVRAGDSVQIPVPAGAYSVRASHGQRWFGPENLFGHTTQTVRVLQPMVTSPSQGVGIIFEPGNLATVEASPCGFEFSGGRGGALRP